ncbi:Cyclin-dependent kinase G-1 [Sesamum alatum]|uniref:Cyclin-dependent kinase G-1 n=1 Tax=Sesamum alatum TaxID=300844 RepID=A0AAE1Y328_9LAMI|nr:Cyclin-dependent kinase G-1 [Sesamum alatum]
MHDEAVVGGVKFLQKNGVLHRDLKPSNLLVNKKGELKICDFGAPEVLAGAKAYSSTIDMWSMGYIMAEMMLKELLSKRSYEIEQLRIIYTSFGFVYAKPYYNQLMRRFLAAIAFGGCPMLTQLGFDLLNRLLCLDPEKRITVDEALNHGWFKEFDPYFLWFTKTCQQSTYKERATCVRKVATCRDLFQEIKPNGEDYYLKMEKQID